MFAKSVELLKKDCARSHAPGKLEAMMIPRSEMRDCAGAGRHELAHVKDRDDRMANRQYDNVYSFALNANAEHGLAPTQEPR
jgi:hypothetical protein